MTFAALTIAVISLTFSASQYKPSYEIIIPGKYVGQVKLLLSNEKENDFKVNKYGVGYISQTTFENGFRPTIIKIGENISKQVTGYSIGSYSSSDLSVDYVSFHITEKIDSTNSFNDFDSLLKHNAIDIKRVRKK